MHANLLSISETVRRRLFRLNDECNFDQYQCLNGVCVSRNKLCNGRNDCGDNSDEQYCSTSGSCPKHREFLCDRNYNSYSKCIPTSWKCDGIKDCTYGTDERECKLSTSPSFVVGVEPEPKIKMAPKELAELTVFNRRKAHLFGQITRIRNSLENVDSPLNQVEIRTKLASLSEVKAKIDKLRTESYRVLSDEELMDFEASLDTMEVDADNLEVSLNTLLESSNVNTSELSVKMIFANYNVKLPSINLPEFSGQYIDWLQFKSQFVSLIHDNTFLSDSQKLYYLQSALKGHAKQLQTVNDSYSSLFEALEGRYENKRLIVNSHIAELLKS
ncbi:uncharacterized protein TNCV_2399651 [Trichonephila clavipes]|uniref:Uncharacterized protein n=1 Tax=Trichonephila clavipes TaxID=2585209 RepID=A0A8X6SVU5_TRICX|nr:uncharacterized protein TNCV_2399651 [Trichonephila clavipes]